MLVIEIIDVSDILGAKMSLVPSKASCALSTVTVGEKVMC